MKAIRVPFSFNGGRVDATSDLSRIAEQKIANTLVTNNGERVMNPNYGASTSQLIFGISSALEFADYRVDAIQELKSSVSKTDIIDLRLKESFYGEASDTTTVGITVLYRLPLGSIQTTTVSIAIPGLVTEDSFI